jgi:hypothetical protein
MVRGKFVLENGKFIENEGKYIECDKGAARWKR